MATNLRRNGTIQFTNGSYVSPGAGYTVNAYAPGAVANGANNATSGGTTVINVCDGTGFVVNEYAMKNLDITKVYLVTAVNTSVSGSNTITLQSSTVTAADKDVFFNLGKDVGMQGGGPPSFVQNGTDNVLIYQTPSTQDLYTDSKVTCDSNGTYFYWYPAATTIWELVRNTLGVIVGYFPQNNTLALSSAGGSGDTDIVRWSGTGGNVIQDGYTQDAPTITNAGVINAPAASTFGKSGNIVTIAGSETINQNLTVTGTTTHTGGVTLNSTLTANGAITATGAITQTGGGAIALSGTLTQTATTSTFKDIVERRPIATAGTAIVGGTASSGVIAGSDFTYTGWGSAAVFTINKLGSNDTRFDLIITASASGLAANPTFTLTFKDGTFGTAPFAVVMWNHPSSNPGSSLPLRWSSTQTTLTVTYIGTPSSTFNYGFTVFVLG